MSRTYKRVFILEVSGPTVEIIQDRLHHLPTIARFMRNGALARLRGPLQPCVATSFATLITGKNPGGTGFYDTFAFPAGGYERIPYTSQLLKPRTVFQHLSERGKRVGLLNVPILYPLPELDGFVVTGDEGIGADYARPERILRMLEADGYRVPFGASYSPGREIEFLEHANGVLKMRQGAMARLFGENPWDFGMLTLHLCGEILHAFWKFYDTRHPDHRPAAEVFARRDPLLQILQSIDGMLAQALALGGPDSLVMILGAWGHRLEVSRLHLNSFLEREGYLSFKRTTATRVKHRLFRLGLTPDKAERFAHQLNFYKIFHYKMSRGSRAKLTGSTFLSYNDIDWLQTRAVAMGYLGQIYLNVRGHRPLGIVAQEDYKAECQNLKQRLQKLRDPRTGEPIVHRVWERGELYSGLEVTHAPDLIVECREGFVCHSGFAGGGNLVTRSPANHSSDHWNESLFLALGPGIRAKQIDARLEDIAPTVLHALGVEVPPDYEGQVLPIFDPQLC